MAIKGGTIITKVALDDKGLKTSLDGVKKKGKRTATDIEKAWKSMGKKSDQTYAHMKANIEKNYNTIKNHAKSTAADIVRAEKAKALKIARINKQQFASQHKYLNKLKANWKSYAFVGIAAITSMVYATKRLVDSVAAAGDQFHKMSLRTGVAVEELSALGYAAEISGTNVQTVEKSLRYASKVMVDYSRGIGLAKRTFEELGLTVMDSTGKMKGTSAFLLEVSDKIKNMTDETKKAAFISEIFGAKAGTQLLPLLKLGSGGIQELMDKAKELGVVMTTSEAAIAADYTDTMTDMMGAVKGAQRVIGIELLPVLKDVAEDITAWVTANRALIGQKTSEAIDGITTAAKSLWKIVSYDPAILKYGILGLVIWGKKGAVIVGGIAHIGTAMWNLGKAITFAKEGLISWTDLATSNFKELEALIDGVEKKLTSQKTPKHYIDIYAPAKPSAEKPPAAPGAATAIEDAGFAKFKENQDLQLGYFLENLDLRLEGVANYNDLKAKMDEEAAAKEKELQKTKYAMYQTAAGNIAQTFLQISQAGGKQSEEAFKLYKAFAIIQAGMAAKVAIVGALGSPPYGLGAIALASSIAAMTAVQIGMLASAQPPSYDEGGISSAKGIYQTGNIDEAHIPLKGGKVPVSGGGGKTFIIRMENPVFQDLATQQQVMSQIAEVIARKVAPGAVVQDYSNDGQIRQMIRGRL